MNNLMIFGFFLITLGLFTTVLVITRKTNQRIQEISKTISHQYNLLVKIQSLLKNKSATNAVAENAGGLIFLKNDLIIVNENFDGVLFLDVKYFADLNGKNYPSEGIYFTNYAGWFHIAFLLNIFLHPYDNIIIPICQLKIPFFYSILQKIHISTKKCKNTLCQAIKNEELKIQEKVIMTI